MDHPYIDTLIQNRAKAKKVEPVRKFEVSTYEVLANLPEIETAIYIIEEINGDSEKTFQSFSEYKKMKKGACAKLNSPSNVLYVGSSTTGVKKRLMQHLKEGPKYTYALHMAHWFKGKVITKILEYNTTHGFRVCPQGFFEIFPAHPYKK